MPITAPTAEGQSPAAQAIMRNPFVRAAAEARQPFSDRSTLITASAQQVGPVDVSAMGFLRNIVLTVQATGGVGAGVVAKEDAPWTAITSISLEDVNGRPIVGPLDGYDLYLINKWGGIGMSVGIFDPALKQSFSAVGASGGNFSFILRIPVEITAHDGLGSLPNLTASATYKLRYSINASANIYSTPPATTLPTVRVRAHLEAWSQPRGTDPKGTPNETVPPMVGTTSFWSKSVFNITAGEQRVPITRTGNLLRNIIFIFRNTTPARNTTNSPDPMRLEWDNKILDNWLQTMWLDQMQERYGQAADTGVLVYDFIHDADGRPGNENRHLYIPTVQGTRFEYVGTFGVAGTLTILVNDVAPAGGVVLDSGNVGR